MAEAKQMLLKRRLADPLLRVAGAAAVLVVATLFLWLAGLLFAAGAEEIVVTHDDGQQRLLQARPADTGVHTPNPSGQRGVGPSVGLLAPNFDVSNLDGQRVQLADYRGRPVILNFWASWCGPCIAEMPDLEAVMERFAEEGLVVFALNAAERFEAAYYFIREIGVSLTAFGLDPTADVIRLYRVHGLPASFFIDRDGVITSLQLGQMTEEQIIAHVLEALESGNPSTKAQ
jgi:thiol-disulfide isomerase/thioredoxin